MDDYNRYVTAVNKIFDYIEKMKAGWNNMDNRNYIDSIDEYKSVVTAKADAIRKPPTVKVERAGGEETLSLDFDDDASEESKEAPAPSPAQGEIKTFSATPQTQVKSLGGLSDIPQMGGFPGIKEAARIPSVEALPIPESNNM